MSGAPEAYVAVNGPNAAGILTLRRGFRLSEVSVGLGLLGIIVFLGFLFANVRNAALGATIPGLALLTSLSSAATVAVLLSAAIPEGDRRASHALAVALGVSAAFSCAIWLVVPGEGGLRPFPPLGLLATIWLTISWRAVLAVLAMYYAALRFHETSPDAFRAALPGRLLLAAIAAIGVVLCAFYYSNETHSSLAGIHFGPLHGSWIVLAVTLLTLSSAVLLWAIPRPTTVDQAFALTLTAAFLSLILDALSSERFTGTWYAARSIQTVGSMFVLVALVRGLLVDRLRLVAVQRAFHTALLEGGLRAKQFRALWQAASIDGLALTDHTQAVLDIGAANLRPGSSIYGYLSHEDDGRFVVDAISDAGTSVNVQAERPHERPALTPIFEGTVERQLIDARHSIRSNGQTIPAGWAAFVATPLRIGTKGYFLTFASLEPLPEAPFQEDDVAFVEVLASQITSRYHQEDQLARIRYQMEHDPLTGLFNVTEFRKVARRAIMEGQPFGVLRINLDNFGALNESEGYMIGDEILVEVGVMLNSVSPRDIVARVGGDKFAVVTHDVTSEAALAERAELYRKVFDQPFHTGDRTGTRFLPVSASLGAALFPTHATDYEALIRSANVARDAAKAAGGGTAVLFSDTLREQVELRDALHKDILAAISDDAFVLEYQPSFDLATRSIVGAEALIRWNHPTRGRLMPDAFIPFAESNGLIERLSRWVLARMLDDLSELDLPRGFYCYMNVPARLLSDVPFLSLLEAKLSESARLRGHIGIEITESEAMHNIDETIVALRALRRRGIRIAIDDFGTGYSSLAYLKRLPIDVVKLDKAFVRDLPNDASDIAVNELFLGLTERLGLVSLAEGIETDVQAEWLRAHGCKVGQGFLVSRSLPCDDFKKLLATRNVRPAVLEKV